MTVKIKYENQYPPGQEYATVEWWDEKDSIIPSHREMVSAREINAFIDSNLRPNPDVYQVVVKVPLLPGEDLR